MGRLSRRLVRFSINPTSDSFSALIRFFPRNQISIVIRFFYVARGHEYGAPFARGDLTKLQRRTRMEDGRAVDKKAEEKRTRIYTPYLSYLPYLPYLDSIGAATGNGRQKKRTRRENGLEYYLSYLYYLFSLSYMAGLSYAPLVWSMGCAKSAHGGACQGANI